MKLDKSEKIRRFLTKQDNQNLYALINGEISVSDISKRYDTSKQFIYHILAQLGYEDINQRRKEHLKKHLNDFWGIFKEGIPVEALHDRGQLDVLFQSDHKNKTPRRVRELVTRRFKQYNVTGDDNQLLKSVMIRVKLESYIQTLQIEWAIKNTNLRNRELIDIFGVSSTKIINIKDSINLLGRALPKLPESLVNTINRNIRIVFKSEDGQSIEDLSQAYQLDSAIIEMIIEETKPFMYFDSNLLGMRND